LQIADCRLRLAIAIGDCGLTIEGRWPCATALLFCARTLGLDVYVGSYTRY
jgi:hypothetical protein